MRKAVFLLLIALSFSCEEKVNWDLQGGDLPPLVVEAWLTNELKRQEVILSKPVTALNDVPEMVSGAIVTLNDGESTYTFVEEEEGSGIYLSDTLQAVIDKEYLLTIEYDSMVYTAEAYMDPVSPFQDLPFIESNDNPGYYYLEEVLSNQPAMEELYLDWSAVLGEEVNEDNTAELIFYVLDASDVNELFPPESEVVEFPSGTTILRKKYSLNDDQQDFVRSVLMETIWRGGVFDVQKDNVATNISGDAIGYFGISSVITQTVIVE